jgi:hypothetical protein
MKKYIFITPEGLSFKPSSDSPEPDQMDMQILSFGQEHTLEDTLNDLIEFNGNAVENRHQGSFSIRIERNNHKNLWLREKKYKIPLAS